jgi:hypothetical protein
MGREVSERAIALLDSSLANLSFGGWSDVL